MKRKFIEHTFKDDTLKIIDQANAILSEYQRQGYKLSLRQLYYQFVARGLRENTERSYKALGGLISDARNAGLIDWDMIEDRGRDTVTPSHWDSPADIIRAAAQSFRIDKWADQDWHIEVMVEKDALSGVLEPICRQEDIRITANKGYSSSSTMYEIGRRLHSMARRGKDICIVYLGDHDPSGLDMTRDVLDRLRLYSEMADELGRLDVVRVALNYDQVQQWNPPPNPAKTTDSRSKAYIDQYGETSWELDAVSPTQLAGLLQRVIAEHRDDSLWREAVEREQDWRQELNDFADNYEE